MADRVAAAYAGSRTAERLQERAGLPERPSVTYAGVPFLTQAVRGRYRDVRITVPRVPAGEVTLRDVRARLHGARVPLSDALSDDVAAVPVERAVGTGVLTYDELSRRSGDRALTVVPSGDRVRVRGSVRVLGRELSAVAVSRVEVDGDEVVVTAEAYEVGNDAADAVLTRVLRGQFDYRFPLQGLPPGLSVSAVEVRPEGLTLRAVGVDAVLPAR